VDAEIIVVGAGLMGTSAALELARRGHRVTVLEQFDAGHSRGSSHGPTRIFRFSYQDPVYVELALEGWRDWQRLERDLGAAVVEPTGGIDIGEGAALCAQALSECGVVFEELDAKEILERFDLHVAADSYGIFQESTGVIAASKVIASQAHLASLAGAEFRYGVKVRSISPGPDGVEVVVEDGSITSERAVVGAGAWTRQLAQTAKIELPLLVTKEQVAYFSIARDLPVIIDWNEPTHYLVPKRHEAAGIRVGLHHHGGEVDPDLGPFEPTDDGIEEVTSWLEGISGQKPELIAGETCLYTNAPNEDFVFAQDGPLLVVSACSGHGFKFGPRMGRAAADLIEDKDPGLPERLIWRERPDDSTESAPATP